MKITKHIGAFFLILFTLILILQQTIENFTDIKASISTMVEEVCIDIDPVTDGEITEAYDIRDSLLASNPYFYIKELTELEANDTDYPNKQKDKDDYQQKAAKAAIQVASPWIILLLITLLMYILLAFCLSKCCPPCSGCKCREAEKKRDIQISVFISFILLIICLALAITGLAFAGQTSKSLKSLRCSGVMLFQDINTGVQDSADVNVKKWKGLQGLKNSVIQIEGQIDQIISDSKATLDKINPSELNSSYDKLLIENKKLDRTITYASTGASLNVGAGGSSTQSSFYQSNSALLYIQNGTYNSQNDYVKTQLTATTPQYQIFNLTYQNILDQISAVKENGQGIINDQTQIKNSLTEAQQKIQENIDEFETNAQDFFKDTENVNDAADAIQVTIYILFGVAGLFILIFLISICCIYNTTGARNCGKNTLLFCCMFNVILLIVYFVLCAVLAISVGVLAEGCDYLDGLVSFKINLENTTLFTTDQKELFSDCIFGDGDVLDRFDIKDTVEQAEKLDLSINKFKTAKTEYTTQMSKGNDEIAKNKLFIQNFVTFRMVDYSEPTTTDLSNIKYMMQTGFKGECSGGSSVVESQGKCSSTQQFYDPQNGENFPTATTPMCFQTSIFNFKQTETQAKFGSCPEFSTVQKFYGQQNDQWNQVLKTENQIIDAHNQNQGNLTSKIDDLLSYANSIQAYLVLVVDPNTGILGSINCNFMKVTIRRMINDVCVRNLRLYYFYYVFFGVISVGLSICVFFFFRLIVGVKSIQEKEELKQESNQSGQKYEQPPDQAHITNPYVINNYSEQYQVQQPHIYPNNNQSQPPQIGNPYPDPRYQYPAQPNSEFPAKYPDELIKQQNSQLKQTPYDPNNYAKPYMGNQ